MSDFTTESLLASVRGTPAEAAVRRALARPAPAPRPVKRRECPVAARTSETVLGKPLSEMSESDKVECAYWLYQEKKSVHAVGAELGVCGETIRAWLKKANLKLNKSRWTEEDLSILRKYYSETAPRDFDLDAIAKRLGRTRFSVSIKAGRLGISDDLRPNFKRKPTKQKELPWSTWVKHPHPRGMLGKKHNPEVVARLIATRKANDEKRRSEGTGIFSQEARQRFSDRMTELNRSGKINSSNSYSRARRGYRDDLGKIFFRSRWEANIARYLNFLRARGDIEKWEFESQTFWFEKIKRGVRSYLPDFKVFVKDQPPYFIEVKGWMDRKSATKLKRMAKYYPDVRIDVIDEQRYRGIERTAAALIPNWEKAGKRSKLPLGVNHA